MRPSEEITTPLPCLVNLDPSKVWIATELKEASWTIRWVLSFGITVGVGVLCGSDKVLPMIPERYPGKILDNRKIDTILPTIPPINPVTRVNHLIFDKLISVKNNL
jgi:hypothetical protein